jgi:hypothetical protein
LKNTLSLIKNAKKLFPYEQLHYQYFKAGLMDLDTNYFLADAASLPISRLFQKKSSSSLSFSASISSNVKRLSLNEARYFLTVLRDVSAWAAIDMILRPLVYILIIFLILLMVIVGLAMLLEVILNLQSMVASTALAARSGWSVWPGLPGQLAPEWGGQFDAEPLVTFRRNQAVNIHITYNKTLL